MKCVSEGGELIPPGCPSTAPPRRGRPRHYVDLYLVHWPGGGATWAWPGMEAARARSYARAIGVSNFDTDELDQVIAGASGAPVVDQVQFNPSAYRQVLLDACAERVSRLRPTARWAPASCWMIRCSRASSTASGEAPLRSFCAGASSGASPSSRSRPIATASPRTRGSSTFSPHGRHGAARRARSLRRDPSGTGAQMVVNAAAGVHRARMT
jgi:hypothetical protein